MADGKTSIARLKFSNFKLKTLLNVTQSIVSNLPVADLLADYQLLLQEQLNVGKVLIYINRNNTWNIILKFGVDPDDYSLIDPERDLRTINDICVAYSMSTPGFNNFDFVIPIMKDDRPLAYALIGDFDGEQKGISPSIKHLQFIQTVTNIILMSIENHRLAEENMQQERIKKELEMASKMQNMLIPQADIFNMESRITVFPFYMPHYEVGGDYYDFDYLNDDEMFFCIADVSGKGMSAAILMSNFQASLKALFVPDMDLPTLVSRLNRIVVKNSDGDRFITMFIGRYNFKTHTLRYVNAGHNSPLLYNRSTRKTEYLTLGCPGIGMLDEIPTPKEGIVEMDCDYQLLCFTDGVVEMEVAGIQDFGQSVAEQCVSLGLDIKTSVSTLIQTLDINRTNRSIKDDVTLLGIDFHVLE